MRIQNDTVILSAQDLTGHLACRHLTQLNRAVAEGRRPKPEHRHDDHLALLIERGIRFEENYVAHLESQSADVVRIQDAREHGQTAVDQTLRRMKEGRDYIVQATLHHGDWYGIADILRKVPGASALGDFHYEAIDTKLATETKAATVLQLCLYTDLLGQIQDCEPELFHVVKPGEPFQEESFRFQDFSSYYGWVKRRTEDASTGEIPDTYPHPVTKCDVCRWWSVCNARRREDDHLSFVAGISRLQTGELERQGITRLEAWADQGEAIPDAPKRGTRQGFERAHLQAKAQTRARRSGDSYWELIDYEQGRGLALLPAPNPGDVFFDIESDNYAEDGGLEYLFGVWFEEDGAWQYNRWWARTHFEEGSSFEAVVDFLVARWEQYPDFHIYHFSPYDKAALSRLMGRHGTREIELDRLLRGQRFVDLMAVMRQGVRAGIEGYGLKDLEPLIGFERELDLKEARKALRAVAWDLELGRLEDWDDGVAALVEDYNREDCAATAALRRWLEDRRADLVAEVGEIPRPVHDDGVAEKVEERAEEVRAVFEALLDSVPADPAERSDEEQARWLLAYMLEYHRREDKVNFWEKFRLEALDDEQRERDRHAIAWMECLGVVDQTKTGIPVKRYRYGEQEISAGEGDKVWLSSDQRLGEVVATNPADRTLDIKHMRVTATEEPTSVFVWDHIGTGILRDALLETGRAVLDGGAGALDATGQLRLASPPRHASGASGELRRAGEPLLDAASRLARDLDRGVLPIQGPPGTGKTWIGARMIVDLLRRGKRVGVTAVSHKVIQNMLLNVLAADPRVCVAHQPGSNGPKKGFERYAIARTNDKVLDALQGGEAVGATVFHWAKPAMMAALDYLFVDEAGQMSLANAVAASRAATNVVLLGDPQQLEQPQRGSHPEGADIATLVHMLRGAPTIAGERGLFLDETWRLPPPIVEFTSENYYERRLRPHPRTARQELVGAGEYSGSGIFYLPVEHAGNQSSSAEEVDAVAVLCEGLLADGATWIDADGNETSLTWDDILIVAPYNDQVGALQRRLPSARVGTVDKFQGQEAPVVVYSMASSSATDAPRGMRFLYSPNRLNVATSRARCVCVVVAAPAVMEPECGTVEAMRWANGVASIVSSP